MSLSFRLEPQLLDTVVMVHKYVEVALLSGAIRVTVLPVSKEQAEGYYDAGDDEEQTMKFRRSIEPIQLHHVRVLHGDERSFYVAMPWQLPSVTGHRKTTWHFPRDCSSIVATSTVCKVEFARFTLMPK